jgi:hypothetical protein
MATIKLGMRICWGSDPRWATLPISNLPLDCIKVRRRIRLGDVARAYVKTATSVQHWCLAPVGDYETCAALRLDYFQGENKHT